MLCMRDICVTEGQMLCMRDICCVLRDKCCVLRGLETNVVY
jgi:hypothetical protein